MTIEDQFNLSAATEIPVEKRLEINDKITLKNIAKEEFVSYVKELYQEAKDGKRPTEDKAIESFQAWRGVNSWEEQANIAKMEARTGYPAPKIFLRITKTKTQAAYSQLVDVLFAGNRFPLGLEPTPVPEGVPEYAFVGDETSQQVVDAYGYSGDGNDLEPGDTYFSRFKKAIGSLTGKTVGSGPSPDKTKVPQIHPADESARQAEKLLHDQLTESNAEFALRNATYESVMLGTGIIKGPFNYLDTTHKWEYKGDGVSTYTPETKLVPRINQTSFWNFFPDPSCTSIDDAEYAIERHKLTKTGLKALRNMPFFDEDAIARVLQRQPDVVNTESYDSLISDNANAQQSPSRYEALEFWGYMTEELARRLDVTFSDDDVIFEQIMVNGWICGGEVLKLVVNPFEPQRLPYLVFPYEEHPNQLWGIGVPENMTDVQQIMNGHMRMAIENLRLAGNMVFEVNEAQLKPGQDMSIYAGKIFRKQGGAPGQSVFGLTFPNVAPAHFQMISMANQFADQSTGIPSIMHGQTGVSSAGRAAASMSMLMSAAALNIKTVVKNIDHYLLEPLGRYLYYWNMQFNPDNFQIKGDVKIVAKGTASVMQREVLTQRLISLIQVAANPIMAPFLNAPEVFKQIVINMGFDPEKLVNDPTQAMIYAELLQKTQGMNNANAGQGNSPEANAANGSQGGGSPQGAGGQSGETGFAGNGVGGIGVGNVPQPGESTFTGNT